MRLRRKNGPFDVFLIAGQSNAEGNGVAIDATLDGVVYSIYQYKRDTTIVPAKDPLDHFEVLTGRVGFPLSFAAAYYVATKRRVLLVPCARSGTGFSSNVWNPPSDAGYTDSVARTNAAIATKSGNILKGILWHQGETDALVPWTANQYTTALVAMVAAFRANITGAATIPFVCGGMTPDFTASGSTHGVRDALIAAPGNITKCAYVDPTGLTSNPADAIHFDAASQRTLGGLYYTAWATL